MASTTAALSRTVIGEPLRSDRLDDTLLPKRLALPVFCSDPLSSVAYATEQIVLVLGLGGLALLHLTPWMGVAVVGLLVIVVASYRQTCAAYPNGGGSYAVSRDNLGEHPALVAASALLIDYVLTVAVSVVAGVAAITSAVPALEPHAVALSLGCVVLLTAVNLRGVKESGRAFASGCTALTGVEAVSNGIPGFQPPKSRNAATTLLIMGVLAITMFAGITALAIASHVHMAEDTAALVGFHGGTQRTALSQIGLATFGDGVMFFLLQGFTAAILVLAANTAFNGFPVLASLLGHHGY